MSDSQKEQITTGCCDMSAAYIAAITTHCPNATLVIDRFHLVKALNEVMDEVRKQQWREGDTDERKTIKGLRWLLYRHSSTRTTKHTRALNALERGNRRIYRAWKLKDEFEAFWNYKAPWAGVRFLDAWMKRVMRSRLDPLKKFVRTVRKHYDGVAAFVETGLTNAVSEGLNRIVKIVKNRAGGVRTLHAFADLIFLTVGDLDIPE